MLSLSDLVTAKQPLLPKVARCIPVLSSRYIDKCSARVLKRSDSTNNLHENCRSKLVRSKVCYYILIDDLEVKIIVHKSILYGTVMVFLLLGDHRLYFLSCRHMNVSISVPKDFNSSINGETRLIVLPHLWDSLLQT